MITEKELAEYTEWLTSKWSTRLIIPFADDAPLAFLKDRTRKRIKTITIDEELFLVQAYSEGEFINLCHLPKDSIYTSDYSFKVECHNKNITNNTIQNKTWKRLKALLLDRYDSVFEQAAKSFPSVK